MILRNYANFADVSLDLQANKRQGLRLQTSDICDDGNVLTAPVGTYKPNGFGLYDMHGNVLQWTEDCYLKTYENAPRDGSPYAAENCVGRVARGGPWNNAPGNLRSAYRLGLTSGDRLDGLGFRVGRVLKP